MSHTSKKKTKKSTAPDDEIWIKEEPRKMTESEAREKRQKLKNVATQRRMFQGKRDPHSQMLRKDQDKDRSFH